MLLSRSARRRPHRYIALATILIFLIWYLLFSESPADAQAVSQDGDITQPQNKGQHAAGALSDNASANSGGDISMGPSEQKDQTSPKNPKESSPSIQSAAEKERALNSLDTHPSKQEPLGSAPPSQPEDARPKPANSDKPTQTAVETEGDGDLGPRPCEYVQIGNWSFCQRHRVKVVQELKGLPIKLPKLQHDFEKETSAEEETREERRMAVKEAFQHAWKGYREHAWLADELKPVTGVSRVSFGGWAATLVDSLDTLWIMGLKDDFEDAVNATSFIDFTDSEVSKISVFETTIRYLGGLLGAYDISERKYPVLLDKAKELGNLLYCSFDTPNHMPVTHWSLTGAKNENEQEASGRTVLADLGSLSLEFTRLSQLTGDMRYFDAITRVMEEMQRYQGRTRVPGLWPQYIDARRLTFSDTTFTLSSLGDSMYEYLPKQHMLLGGKSELIRYDKMYDFAITAAMNHIFFQPMVPDGADILLPGLTEATNMIGEPLKTHHRPLVEHLGCYAGAMVGIGAKIFDHPEHMNMARKLVDGCIWAYKAMPTGIMPEKMDMLACEMNTDCVWNQTLWEDVFRDAIDKYHIYPAEGEKDTEEFASQSPIERLMKDRRIPTEGITSIVDRRFLLRPEAIESVFVHYRLTGDKDLPGKAWQMFQSIDKATRTDIAHSAIADVTKVRSNESGVDFPGTSSKGFKDEMESFWLAETLKYFYLIFSKPEVVSLDEFVFNTEAHPLRRPVPGEPFVKKKEMD